MRLVDGPPEAVSVLVELADSSVQCGYVTCHHVFVKMNDDERTAIKVVPGSSQTVARSVDPDVACESKHGWSCERDDTPGLLQI